MGKGRLTVHTIKRRRCARCHRTPGYATWECCADGNLARVLCLRCDMALNRLVLRWMRDRRAKQKMAAYVRKVMKAAAEREAA